MSDQIYPKIDKANLSPDLEAVVLKAKDLYKEKLAYFAQTHKPPAFIVAAPGRVNLIGDHTDYNNGFCLPLAIDFCCVAYGTGIMHTGKGKGATNIRIRMVSDRQTDAQIIEERKLVLGDVAPPDDTAPSSWTNYVLGVIAQYLPDLPPEGCAMDLAVAFSSNVPVGAGLSSSASLEVATAVFLECFMHDMAFSSARDIEKGIERAIRCQRAENEWAHVPCGVMDQYASSVAQKDTLMLIDCQTLEYQSVPMKMDDETPVILICNSNVEHSNADSEYGTRRRECQDALEAMQQVPLYHVLSLRDANLGDCDAAKAKMDDKIYGRAKHVVTENKRVTECKMAVKLGLWERAGDLMNNSHASLRDDYECSCEEVDYLVDLAQKFDGVFGSRMTGGGFGGCTVTLVKKEVVDDLISALKAGYKEKYEKDCDCFVTLPAQGARVLAIDMDIKQE